MGPLEDAHLCPSCSKLFCLSCVSKWISEHTGECPHCRCRLTTSRLVKCRWMNDVTASIAKLEETRAQPFSSPVQQREKSSINQNSNQSVDGPKCPLHPKQIRALPVIKWENGQAIKTGYRTPAKDKENHRFQKNLHIEQNMKKCSFRTPNTRRLDVDPEIELRLRSGRLNQSEPHFPRNQRRLKLKKVSDTQARLNRLKQTILMSPCMSESSKRRLDPNWTPAKMNRSRTRNRK